MRLVRVKGFSAGYRTFDPVKSESENQLLYGRAAKGPGLGSNFVLEAHVEGEVDPLTGMIVNLVDLDRWLAMVTGALDHQMLHELEPFLREGGPVTLERIAHHCYLELERLIARDAPHAKLAKVCLRDGMGSASHLSGMQGIPDEVGSE